MKKPKPPWWKNKEIDTAFEAWMQRQDRSTVSASGTSATFITGTASITEAGDTLVATGNPISFTTSAFLLLF